MTRQGPATTAQPRVDWRLTVMCTSVLTILFTTQQQLNQTEATHAPVLLTLTRQTIVWGVWLLLTPPIVIAARRYPFGDASRTRWVLGQLLLGGLFALVHSIIGSAIRMGIGIAVYDNLVDATLASFLLGIGRNYLTYGLIAAIYQAVAYHQTIRERDREAARLAVDLAEARLATLENRLRPHFLFNTLNAIAALVREDPDGAETMVGQLSDLLRASLRTDLRTEIRLEDELHLVRQYLAIQQARFQDRLHISVDVTDAARAAYVPQLILQPLVENAVRHGIAPRETGGSVWVYADQPDGRLRLTVEDDGVGIGNAPAANAGSGIGLEGLKSRLAHLYGAEQRVDVMERKPTGTRVMIEIPYHQEPHAE
jgi:two-component system, LytTR family, sensor kinase